MWRYLEGARPPNKRPKLSEDEKKTREKDYEDKRERSFQMKWLQQHKWLRFDESKNIMTCNTCIKYSYSSDKTWVEGTSTFKLYIIKKHETTRTHLDAANKMEAEKIPTETPAARSLISMNKKVLEKMTYLFRNAHAIAKKCRPYTDFKWQCELDEQKGIDIGNTYRNDKEAAVFVQYIAEIERRKIREKISHSTFLSLISDGSTDSSIKETEILYIRSVEQGVVSTSFVGVKHVPKADADHITEATLVLLRDSFGTIWQEKIVAVATDGAAVMTGKKNGVVSKIRQFTQEPNLLGIHCMAHRLELAFKDATKDISVFKKVYGMLLALYYFYHNSPLNRANLHVAYEALGIKPVVPTRVGGTRWIGHMSLALTRVIQGYRAIVCNLEQTANTEGELRNKVSSNKAKGLLKVLKDKNHLCFLHFLLDVSNALTALSKHIQQRDATLASILCEIKAVKSVLIKYKQRYGLICLF